MSLELGIELVALSRTLYKIDDTFKHQQMCYFHEQYIYRSHVYLRQNHQEHIFLLLLCQWKETFCLDIPESYFG